MEDEKRVYLLNAEEIDLEGLHINEMSNEDFKVKAEIEGEIYTLEAFAEAFNLEEVNSATDYIRIV